MSKARVAPLKTLTIPRLELSAALVSVRVSSLLQNELKYQNPTHIFCTDSRVVLGYISNDSRRFHVFVANRVQQIRDVTSPSQWRYVETQNNPADLASRGATPIELSNSVWFTGPKFLWQSQLPVGTSSPEAYADLSGDPEVKGTICLASSLKLVQQGTILERLEYFSDWERAKRAVALCLRFKDLLKRHLVKKPRDTVPMLNKAVQSASLLTPLSVESLQEAEIEILRITQMRSFPEEVEALSRQTPANVEAPPS